MNRLCLAATLVLTALAVERGKPKPPVQDDDFDGEYDPETDDLD